MKTYEAIPLPDWQEKSTAEMIAAAQGFYETMSARHSVRAFSDRAIPREVIEAAVKAAGTAPSGANHQPWFFSIIGTPAVKKELRERAEREERAFYTGKGGEEWLDVTQPRSFRHLFGESVRLSFWFVGGGQGPLSGAFA